MTRQANLTLKEILNIPGNRTVFDALTSTLRDNEAIAFVGAGTSAGMYPMWGKFIELLADYAVAEGKAESKDAARWKADRVSTPQQRVSVILRKLGQDRYRNFLKETFGLRKGPDGKRYTATHAALLRLPFRGYVTTHYDPALEFARMDLRPGLTTGTPTWQDEDEVHRWYTGDVFNQEEDCPIIWLHGYWQRPKSIVLDRTEYAAAYKPGLYRRLFEALWGQRHLVFIGFGFNDPQFTFMIGEYLRDLENVNALARHVAILGLPVEEDGTLPDTEAVREWRDNLESDYHVRTLFYPVRGDDHSALHALLDSVADECGCAMPSLAAVAPIAQSPSPPAREDLQYKWFHEPTNDDKFIGRDDEIARLDRWVRDAAVRAVGISAVGGTGKTALIGHWLKETAGWRSRPFRGLFAWSFYQDRDTSNFLRELLVWAHETLGTPKPNKETDLVDAALAASRAHPLIVVLDGLEVLQEGPEDVRHGTFLDGNLREFLATFCQREHRSLAVLTSRFIFADLDRFLGTAFHQLELHGLSPVRGAELLDELGVGGPAQERAYISEQLDGHPLGLRVFADALPDEDRAQPQRFLDYAFRPGQIPEGAPLNDKLRRLLVFYEKKLPPVQTRLLSVVALFRSPVTDETVLRLVRGLFSGEDSDLLPDDAALAAELKRLQARGILSREPLEGGHGSACHPILRDHFRAVLLGTGADTARRAADLLKGQPSFERPGSLKEIEPVLLAIELLLDAGEFAAADDLYSSRLESGQIFLKIPASANGLACALGFVRDNERRRQCDSKLPRNSQGFYLNDVGVFAMYSGHFELALHYFNESNAFDSEGPGVQAINMSSGLGNKATLFVTLGRLAEAHHTATEAIRYAMQGGDTLRTVLCHAYRGWAATLSGQVRPAAEDLVLINEVKKRFPDTVGDHSLRGFRWIELLLLTGHSDLANYATRSNLRMCERNRWNDSIALCHWLLGWCALIEGNLNVAEAKLDEAEPILRRGQLLFELARLQVTAGQVAVARRKAEGALDRAAEALALAAPRGMRLVHADALVLRGRARMIEVQADSAGRALDDAEEALRLARECGYAWGERDALFLAADARAALGAGHHSAGNTLAAEREHDSSRRARADADALAARLVLTKEDLAEADAKAAVWLNEWKETEGEE